ncbi:MAG: hypothetical protein LJE89_14835 [Deltaproteobacteria bacterium]|nr:hypothetical protein [Deltaproteobacteria bacterium]
MGDLAYTIRPFPRELHRKAKATAALEGITLREIILRALTEYVDKRQSRLTGSKPTLEELLYKVEEDTERIIGSAEAKRVGKWREFEGNYLRIIPFVQWRIRVGNEEIATKLDNEGGLSLERIAIDYYPEFFNPGDIQQAKKNLRIEQ